MEPTAFLTLDTLNTLAGQLLAVAMVTQTVKAAVPTLATYWLRGVALGTGILLHLGLVWHAGMAPSAYSLALINGTLVALTAMKGVELIKNGSTKPPPPPPTVPAG